MIIKGITKSSAAFYKSLLAEFKPNWNVEITIEDYNLYKLGFVEEIPCSISLNVSREEIYELQEEILDMEVTIYSNEDILYKNPMDMTDDEKKIYKKLKELEKRYHRNLLGGLYRENPVKSRNYEAVKSSKKWENVGNSYIIRDYEKKSVNKILL